MASIVGTIRSGGVGLADLTVRGYEEIRVGIELDDVAGDHIVKSLGGEVELVVPDGAVPYPTDLLFEDARDVEPPPLGSGDAVLVAPQRIGASGGDRLQRAVMLHLEAGSIFAPRQLRVELLRYDETRRAWRPEPARVNRLPVVASASVDRLGVFCLVGRAGDRS